MLIIYQISQVELGLKCTRERKRGKKNERMNILLVRNSYLTGEVPEYKVNLQSDVKAYHKV